MDGLPLPPLASTGRLLGLHGVMASAGREAEAAVRATNVRTRIAIADKLKATVMALSKNCTPCVAEQRAACETMRSGWKRGPHCT